MQAPIEIRQAGKKDTAEIAEFLERASLVHRHLDWQGILDWLPQSPFLLFTRNDRLQAMLTCPPDFPAIAWIRCFACERSGIMSEAWSKLFQTVCRLPMMKGFSLFSVGLNDWFAELLDEAGFENFQNIVVLQWHPGSLQKSDKTPSHFIRPMEIDDLDKVAALDRLAFESMWVNPADKIRKAYLQSEHASVVEVDGRIIAYEMSTANQFSAHLARIAVHPDMRQRHIASDMILEMLYYFVNKDIHQISVNTQSNNESSLALYKSLGFKLTGESFPVFRYVIS
jgi:ribosomal-protein-alanine N-acetyltransferase